MDETAIRLSLVRLNELLITAQRRNKPAAVQQINAIIAFVKWEVYFESLIPFDTQS